MTVRNYEIRIRGCIKKLVLDPLDGLNLTTIGENEFVLNGQLVDEPALYGLLDRIHAAGLVLISLRCPGGPGRDSNQGDIQM